MILAKVAIDNYKQYRGHHEFTIPAEATIGVIGANGVGKTTLFEAIEWCLYGPSSIATKDIRPRGYGGFTKVSVVLERSNGNGRYIVERELKRQSSASATIFEVDEAGDNVVLVQGPRQVSHYVATKLVGLSHVAFAATFFTRQKELHFFGNLGDTNRRREVGKLLGLETIRAAQQSIADDRKRSQTEADVLRRQYDQQSSGRDFAAELAAAAERIAQCEADVAAAVASASRLGQQLSAAEEARRALQDVKDQDAVLGQQILQVTGEMQASTQRLAVMAEEITRLDAREAARSELVPVAATLEAVRAEIARLDVQRATFFRKREITAALGALRQRRLDSVDATRAAVTEIQVVSQIDGWLWGPTDDDQPAAAIDRLLTVIGTLDLKRVEERESALLRCRDLAQELARSAELLERYRARRQSLDEQKHALLQSGDPAELVISVQHELDINQQQIATLTARRAALEGQRDQARQLVGNLERADFGDRCPTCARPFSEHDAALVVTSLHGQVEALTMELDENQKATMALRQRGESLSIRRNEVGQLNTRLADVRRSIHDSVSHLRDQEDVVARHRAALDEALGRVSLSEPPALETLRDANRLANQYRQMLSARITFAATAARLAEIETERGRVEEELRAIGEVLFDEETHRQTVVRHQEASRAQTTIEQIEQDLARRPALTRERNEVGARITERTSVQAELERQRAALGFDPAALTRATECVETARRDERAAVHAFHAAQTALRDAGHEQATLKADQSRVKQLAEKADERRRDYDLLDRMYREFTEFERYAAARLTPILGDLTSELVREITDGKYDRVEFDGNFGIQVFDGEEERFPLEGFSGGERDAISLAARLALSRMIAAGATNPPGFLVLDEVFGSLDRDRRTRLLDLIGRLSNTFDDFRQLFIISHVDDVRTSAVFDELWRIEETGDGSSRVGVLGTGEDIGEL